MAVRDVQQHFVAQPLGPQQLLLLLARGAEAATAAGEGDQNALAALTAPQSCKAVLQEAALQELPQHPLHHRAQRPMLSGAAGGPNAQQLLEVLLGQPVERRFARTPRLVDPTADLHTSRPAGGRASGENRRASVPSWPAPSGRETVSTAGGSARVRRSPLPRFLRRDDRLGDLHPRRVRHPPRGHRRRHRERLREPAPKWSGRRPRTSTPGATLKASFRHGSPRRRRLPGCGARRSRRRGLRGT